MSRSARTADPPIADLADRLGVAAVRLARLLRQQDEGELTHCSIYQSDHGPKACHVFPFDPLDLHMLQREIGNSCTFYYEGEPEPIPRLEYAKIVLRHLVEKSRNRKRRPALESNN